MLCRVLGLQDRTFPRGGGRCSYFLERPGFNGAGRASLLRDFLIGPPINDLEFTYGRIFSTGARYRSSDVIDVKWMQNNHRTVNQENGLSFNGARPGGKVINLGLIRGSNNASSVGCGGCRAANLDAQRAELADGSCNSNSNQRTIGGVCSQGPGKRLSGFARPFTAFSHFPNARVPHRHCSSLPTYQHSCSCASPPLLTAHSHVAFGGNVRFMTRRPRSGYVPRARLAGRGRLVWRGQLLRRSERMWILRLHHLYDQRRVLVVPICTPRNLAKCDRVAVLLELDSVSLACAPPRAWCLGSPSRGYTR